MDPLRIYTFGRLRIQQGDRPLTDLGTRKAEALLVYLACNSRSHPREVLADLLWDERSQQQAQANLRVVLASLRKQLGDYLLIDRDTAALNPQAPVWLDVSELEKGLRGLPASGGLKSAQQAERAAQALDLYQGDFLQGFSVRDGQAINDWIMRERERLHHLAVGGLHDLVGYELNNGEYKAGMAHAARLLELDPLMEDAHRQLMQLLALSGQRGAALAQYETLRRNLADELGVEPNHETTRLYDQIRLGEFSLRESLTPMQGPHLVTAEAPAFPEDIFLEVERPPFVARHEELAQLEDTLEKALGGRGQVMFVSGEAGSGKTALLTEFARRAQEANPDILVSTGSSSLHFGVGESYLPFREVLDLLLGDIERSAAGGAISPDGARLLWTGLPIAIQALVENGRDLIDVFVSGDRLIARASAAMDAGDVRIQQLKSIAQAKRDRPAELEQSLILEQYSRVVLALAEAHPLILMLDDLQWADTATIDLFFYLARRMAHSRILILGAYRPVAASGSRPAKNGAGERHPLESLVNELKGRYGKIEIDLDQIGEDQRRDFVTEFLDTEPNRLGESFRQELYAHSAGHPLFTVELLRAMQGRGDIVKDQDGYWLAGGSLEWDRMPERIEGVIAERIGRLEAGLRQILSVASVEGEVFTVAAVGQILSIDETRLLHQIETEIDQKHHLVRFEVAQTIDRKRQYQYRFRHNLFQRYLYNRLGVPEREVLHHDMGATLEQLYGEQSGEIAAQLAYHAIQAGELERAGRFYHLAADRARDAYANEEAERYYQTALTFVKEGKDRGEILLDRGRVLDRLGMYAEALQSYRGAIDIFHPAKDPDKVAWLYARAALTALLMSGGNDAWKICHDSLSIVPADLESPGKALLLYATGTVHKYIGKPEQAYAFLQQALAMARRLGDPYTQTYALAKLGTFPRISVQEAIQASQEAILMAEQAGSLLLTATSHHLLGWVLHRRLGDLETACSHMRLAAELDLKRGAPLDAIDSLTSAALRYLLLGETNQAKAAYQESRCLFSNHPEPIFKWIEFRIRIQHKETVFLQVMGKLDEAKDIYERIRVEAIDINQKEALTYIDRDLGTILSETGELERAETLLRESIQTGGLEFADNWIRCMLLGVQIKLGKVEDAGLVLAEAEEAVLLSPGFVNEAFLIWCRARMAAAKSRWGEAMTEYAELAEDLETHRFRLNLAQLLCEWAEAYLKRGEAGDPDQACSLLAKAHELYTQMEIPYYADKVAARQGEIM